MADGEHDNVIDLDRLLPIAERIDAEGRDAVSEDDLAFYDRTVKKLAAIGRRWLKGAPGREADHALGLKLFEGLPLDLRERWGKLKVSELALLARAFPEELPPELRDLVE